MTYQIDDDETEEVETAIEASLRKAVEIRTLCAQGPMRCSFAGNSHYVKCMTCGQQWKV